MAFDGTEGSAISLETASSMTAKYRRNNPGKRQAHSIGRDILLEILNQEGCKGLTVYYGENEGGKREVAFVGIDAEEADMLDLIADVSTPKPPFLVASPLNS